jgi:hypothetical protein
MNNLFKLGLVISCTGLIMLFTYLVGNEIYNEISRGNLQPILAVIAGAFIVGGVVMIVRAGGYYGK